MEPKREQKDESRGIEKTVLLIFSLCSVNTIYRLIKYNWPVAVTVLVVVLILVMWFLNLREIFSYQKRVLINANFIMICTFLFSLSILKVGEAFSSFYTMIALLGLYGVIECMYVTLGFSTLYFIVCCLLMEGNRFGISGDWRNMYYALINLSILHICLILWLRGRKKSIDRTVKTIQALKKAERIKDDFLANVSHELRTPLNTILGMSEIIRNETDINEIHKDGYYIQLATGTLMGTVNDILDFSELQSGNVVLENESYNIVTTINDIINMVHSKNENNNIEFIVDLDVNMPRVLEGDEKKIRRIIMNLLGNAIKFTKEGCICLVVGGRKESYGWNLQVKITDTGIGIEEKNIERLFTTYGQVDTSRSRTAEGIGLGLAISKALVEKMGGTIMVQSRFGRGSTFQFVIPQKIEDESPAVTIDNRYMLNVLTYINREHFNLMEIRDAYTENLRRMVEQVHIKNHACRNINEFKRRFSTESYTHVLITFDEYMEDKDYFETIAKTTHLMVVMSQDNADRITDESIIKVFKPFYAVPIIKVLNETSGTGEDRRDGKFVAPDAHILVVDDNVMNLNVIAGLLDKYHIKTTKAQSGDEALELIKTMDYDFVFMDHMMPGKDGIETLNEIRNKRGVYYQKVPVIALTANALAGAREKFLNAGFSDFVEKPVELSVLERVIKRNLPKEKIIYEKYTPNIKEQNEIKQKEKEPKNKEFSIGDLNVEEGILYCGDKEKLICVLTEFCENSNEFRNMLTVCYENKDWQNYKINVHALKSSMKSVGADALSEMAKELEKLSGDGAIEEIPEKHILLLKEYDRVISMIREDEKINIPYLEKIVQDNPPADDNMPEISEEDFEGYVNEFTEAAYSLNADEMKRILGELNNYSYKGVLLINEMKSINKKIEHLDLFSASDLLLKIKNKLQTGGDTL